MADASTRYASRRPAIHASPRAGWMNDPNGLVYIDGVWHAFYQHNPMADTHEDMHWGHVVSDDLLHWRDQPIALRPDRLGQIFSGSAIVDATGSAGLGKGVLVAAFTYHRDGSEAQALAWSNNRGLTWTKLDTNPVLRSHEPDFRDPKLLRWTRDGESCWIMCLAVGSGVQFYRSDDLRSWDWAGTYECTSALGSVCECPDLLWVGDDERGAWLLTFGLTHGGVQGHSGTFGVLGDFDGNTFSSQADAFRLDHGPDFYAAQTFHGAEHPTMLAWLGSWRYAKQQPSTGRRGLLVFPRRLSLLDNGDELGLAMRMPVDLPLAGSMVGASVWKSEEGRALHVAVTGESSIRVDDVDGGLAASIEISTDRVVLTRHTPVMPHYAESYEIEPSRDGTYDVVIDHGSVEVIPGDGQPGISALVFAGESWRVDVDGDCSLTEV